MPCYYYFSSLNSTLIQWLETTQLLILKWKLKPNFQWMNKVFTSCLCQSQCDLGCLVPPGGYAIGSTRQGRDKWRCTLVLTCVSKEMPVNSWHSLLARISHKSAYSTRKAGKDREVNKYLERTNCVFHIPLSFC